MSSLLKIIATDELDYTPIKLGTSWMNEKPVEWNFGYISHPGMMLVGGSGSGKTHAMIKLSKALKDRGLAVHIIDSHGDLDIDDYKTYNFHYNSQYGMNLFAIDPNVEFGGPQATISQVIDLLSSQHSSLGNMQKAMFEHACKVMYQDRGIFFDKPDTWGYEPFGIEDLCDYLESTLISHKLGMKTSEIEKMMKSSAKLRKLNNVLEGHSALLDEEVERYEKQLESSKTDWANSIASASPDEFMDLQDKIRSGFSENGMQSLLILLRKIANKGVFTGIEPTPSDANVVYSVRGLEPAEQVMIVETILGKIFRYYMRNVTELNQPPHTYIFIDEVKLFSSGAFKKPQHILNRIQTEARKSGLALILAGQSLDHVPNDVITNMGTTVVLPIHNLAKPSVSRKLQIPPDFLDNIKPKRDGLVSTGGDSFDPVRLWH